MTTELARSIVQAVAVTFDEVLRPLGFQKRNLTWRLGNEFSVRLVSLQRSMWGGEFYVNLGCLLKELTDLPQPTEANCHVRTRLSNLGVQKGNEVLHLAHRYDSPLPIEQRCDVLRIALIDTGVPFLNEFAFESGAARALERHNVDVDCLIHAAALAHFGIRKGQGETL